jgi:mannose-6-phosphate isomerase-like protein (cupin superfamily)
MRRENVEKPWGEFERFTLNELSTVKLITVKSGESLSLQTHKHRSEFWKIIKGKPAVQIGNSVVDALPGDEFTIAEGEQHRISASADDVLFLEIAVGTFDEDDIVRLEDKYDRIKHD